MIALNETEWRAALSKLSPRGEMRAGIQRVSIDSRDCEDAVFFAIKGERFDAHDFAEGALKNGARLCVVERLPKGVDAKAALIVDDVLIALQATAKAVIQKSGVKRIALSGSNGKTTTKELIAAALLGTLSNERVHKTAGNFNNHVGVPLTAFALEQSHDVAIFELGMNHFGEIALLTELVAPEVALLTSIGSAHAGNLGGLAGVERAKGELFAGLSPSAKAVVNHDDPKCVRAANTYLSGQTRVSFGTKDADVIVRMKSADPSGMLLRFHHGERSADALLPMHGAHNALNAAGAVAVCLAMNYDFAASVRGLAQVGGVQGRLTRKEAASGAWILDDTYNANPDSMNAGLQTLSALANGRRTVAALGEMKEVDDEKGAHYALGKKVASENIQLLFTEGEMGREIMRGAFDAGFEKERAFWAEDSAALAKLVKTHVQANDIVLAKGSRSAAMERVVSALCEPNNKGGA